MAAAASLGLLCHSASLDRAYRPAPLLLARRLPGRLKLLFSPQHGLKGEKVVNMVSSPDFEDPLLKIPVVSLYGPRLGPPLEALRDLEVLLVDLMDVGTRVYTYGATLAKVMAAAARAGVRVVVLDRPNPSAGSRWKGTCSGTCLRLPGGPLPPAHAPRLHPLGELARYYNRTQGLGCDLEVIPAAGWLRCDYFDATGLPWVMPSPNLPTLEGALVYPGQVLLEGTNLSEGRGTTRPFRAFRRPLSGALAAGARICGHAPAGGGPPGSSLRAHLP